MESIENREIRYRILFGNYDCENQAEKEIRFFKKRIEENPYAKLVIEIFWDLRYHWLKNNLPSKNIIDKKRYIKESWENDKKHLDDEHMLGRVMSTYSQAYISNLINGWNLAIQKRDNYTVDHSERVMKYCMALAEMFNLSKKSKDALRYASLAHDIGKIAIDEKILNKPGELTKREFEEIKKHPVIGADILKNSNIYLDDKIIPIVKHHHEQEDGKGYPDGLKGNQLNIETKILIVADAYDVMVSKRPYKEAKTVPESIKELKRNAGKQFDKKVVKVFIDFLRNQI